MTFFKKNKFLYLYIFVLSFLFLFVLSLKYLESSNFKNKLSSGKKEIKLYWFIPDGLRADPDVFKIYQWANEGKLPHLKKLMENGSYGYSIPVFPGHTPTNFATLMTGTTPDVHGISDGAMRMEGYPLSMVAKGGFSSFSKKVSPIWYTLEQNNFLVSLLSVPGSTPPELNEGITIKGRWGGWGIEIPAIIFHTLGDEKLKVENGQNKRVFNFGSELTKFTKANTLNGWSIKTFSFSTPFEVNLNNWSAPLYAMVVDTTNDHIENYDHVIFSKDKKNVLCELEIGHWSNWLPIKIKYELKNDYNINTPKKTQLERDFSAIDLLTEFKIKVIRLDKKNDFRIRLIYNNLNEFLVKPNFLYDSILSNVGPMVDFVDNYPPQLIYFKEDKKTFIEEAKFSFDWHRAMSKYMINSFPSNVIIHSIYTPNQMLTSRWWMPYVDPSSPKYHLVSEMERSILWDEVLGMYKEIDSILGTIMDNLDERSYIVFSSDHGAVPLHKEVRLNNLFAKKKWLKFKYSSVSGEYSIDWENTKVIFLQMDNIYIHTKGLKNIYQRDSGPEYEALRNDVIMSLKELKDDTGIFPLAQILKREESKLLFLPEDRVGDLVIANSIHYNWVEDVSGDLSIFKDSLKGGYKQAVLPNINKGMWTPFVIMGPNVKRNYRLSEPINHVDQYATILRVLKQSLPIHNKGKVLGNILIK